MPLILASGEPVLHRKVHEQINATANTQRPCCFLCKCQLPTDVQISLTFKCNYCQAKYCRICINIVFGKSATPQGSFPPSCRSCDWPIVVGDVTRLLSKETKRYIGVSVTGEKLKMAPPGSTASLLCYWWAVHGMCWNTYSGIDCIYSHTATFPGMKVARSPFGVWDSSRAIEVSKLQHVASEQRQGVILEPLPLKHLEFERRQCYYQDMAFNCNVCQANQSSSRLSHNPPQKQTVEHSSNAAKLEEDNTSDKQVLCQSYVTEIDAYPLMLTTESSSQVSKSTDPFENTTRDEPFLSTFSQQSSVTKRSQPTNQHPSIHANAFIRSEGDLKDLVSQPWQPIRLLDSESANLTRITSITEIDGWLMRAMSLLRVDSSPVKAST